MLLILAGVAIATLTGENGIIQNAKGAKTSTEEKQAEEEAIMIYNEYEMYKKMCEVNGKEANIEEFLTNRRYMYEKKENGIYEITTDSGNKVKIDSNGNLMVNDNVVAVIKAENIQISGAKTVKKGQTAEITATINPGDSIYKVIEWESEDTSKVEVEGNGKECTIRGIETGKVVIRCKITNYDNTETIGEYEIEVLDYNVKTVTISGTSSVEPGKTVTLTATMDANTSEYSKIEWSSSDVAKATVNGNDNTCIVTGKVSGSVTITCKVTNLDGTTINGTYVITILDVNVKSITIGGATIVDKGSNITLTATLNPETTKYTKIEWSSSNTGIATVSGNNKTCTVTGEGVGNATITCKLTNLDNTTVSATYNITSKAILASVAKVGEYVNYNAGNWTSTVALPTSRGYLGGYTSGQSKNKSISPWPSWWSAPQSGWRVLTISGNTVTLVHAGVVAAWYHTYSSVSGPASTIESFCSNNFVNTYASSARSVRRTDYTSGNLNSSTGLLNIDCGYWFPEIRRNFKYISLAMSS